jgi:hypothetical protein
MHNSAARFRCFAAHIYSQEVIAAWGYGCIEELFSRPSEFGDPRWRVVRVVSFTLAVVGFTSIYPVN